MIHESSNGSRHISSSPWRSGSSKQTGHARSIGFADRQASHGPLARLFRRSGGIRTEN
ncbi:MAG: hypothetical protein M3Y91_04720 [Actinomycetota bacterium]|nr:hypothetical protein [Actinomycetota bacterium]